MKYLNFSVAETSGRSFEIPMDKVEEIIKEIKEDDYYAEEEVDFNDSYEVAKFLMNYGLDEITKYELSNDYVELELACSEIVETSEV